MRQRTSLGAGYLVTFTLMALSVYIVQRLDKGHPSFDFLCGKRMPFICGKNEVWTDGRKLMVDGPRKKIN